MQHREAQTRILLNSDSVLKTRWQAVEKAFAAQDLRAFRKALPSLLTTSAKTVKGEKKGILTGILYFSPADESGYNVCPYASPACIAACLGHSSGRMAMVVNGGLGDHKRARILRTWAFIRYRAMFLKALRIEIKLLVKRAERKGMKAYVRLNGTSDLPWEQWHLFTDFPDVQFYDYTKNPARAAAWGRGEFPSNYHLTFSRSEINHDDSVNVLKAGGNVAVVFRKAIPATWHNVRVIDGDETDARPDDTRGAWIGLKAKGPKAKRDRSGFVVEGVYNGTTGEDE